MMVGMPNPIPGSAANHLSFTALPAAAHIVVITDTTGFPALYDFRPGENCGGGPCTLQPWQIVASYPLVIESPAVCNDGTFGYVAGGRDSATFLATDAFNQYDPVANTWTPLAPLLTAVQDARAVHAANTNSIYVFGGIDINFFVLNIVQKYDLGTGTWSTVTPMPAERFFPATVYYDPTGLIYVAGGIDGAFLETDTTWIYDPVADTWDTSTAPNIPVVMGGSAVSLVGQNMYLQGSFGAGATNFNYTYDIVANTWTQKADMPAAVYEAAGASIGTNTYVVGGGDPAVAPGSIKANRKASKGPNGSMARPDTSFNTTYVYDTVADSWTTGPSTNIAHSFTGGTAIGNKLVVVGGFDGVTGDTNTVEASDCGAGGPSPTPTPSGTPVTPTPTPTPTPGSCPPTITQSTSQAIVDGNSVACNNGIGTTENHYWRAFNMNTFTGGLEYDVTSVEFGIELAQSGTGTGQPLTVNLYANHGSPFPLGDWQSNLIGTSGEITIPDQVDSIFNVPLTAIVAAGTLELVMEVTTPDGTVVGNLFFVGSNPDPETGLSYLSAADCGVTVPTPTGDLGFPDMHIVFNVNGSCPAGSPTPTATATATATATTPPASATPTATATATGTPRVPPTPRPRPTPFPRPTP
jgi:N-acetylneuraminic acid mutarotase